MTSQGIDQLFESFNDLRVLVIGDVMIDAYLWGKVDRISPEAPVPVITVTEREDRLGGAANVALNVAAMGAHPIVCAIAGKDAKGEILAELLEKRGLSSKGVVYSSARPTTVKSRVISGHQHIVRVDEESTRALEAEEERAFLENLEVIIRVEKPDVVIFEDYNKGLLTPNVISRAIALSSNAGIPTAVDPKKANFFSYKGVTLYKPNLKELREGLKVEFDKKDQIALRQAVDQLEAEINNRISLITLSEEGVYVKDGDKENRIPAHIRNISDVSGAGDTVISVAALCLAQNTDSAFLAALANLAGGLVCERVGVVPIDRNQLLREAKLHLQKL
ncbi:bifunctional ADP-heptose synthase [Cryomorphaceae bacterium 1068]|nr:bifunctional ADP-heptose synthase [Cryomorphaceae bacterium 1068]